MQKREQRDLASYPREAYEWTTDLGAYAWWRIRVGGTYQAVRRKLHGTYVADIVAIV